MFKILVVDDDAAIRETIAVVLLQDSGHEVTQAASAEDAWGLFEGDSYDLVITDVRMHGMSGLELLRKIKSHNPQTYVVIITGYSTKDYAVSAIRAGAFDYIEKPITDLGTISDTVARVQERIKQENEKNRIIKDLQLEYSKIDQIKRQLEMAIISDSLTGLYNRGYLEDSIQKEVARAKRYRRVLSVAFIDLDNFKTYNDTLGHRKGDELLQRFGDLLLSNIRRPDFAARYGGDEFVLILPEAKEDGAFVAADKLRRLVEQMSWNDGEQKIAKKITISGGVATLGEDMDGKALLETADRALYMAKAEGRNKIKKASEGELQQVRQTNAL